MNFMIAFYVVAIHRIAKSVQECRRHFTWHGCTSLRPVGSYSQLRWLIVIPPAPTLMSAQRDLA